MSQKQEKVNFWRQLGFDVVEKRGWVRVIRSQAKELLSERVYIDCMKQAGWESII